MHFLKQLLTGLLILVPLVFSALVPLTPLPGVLSDARKMAFVSKLETDKISEITALKTELGFTPWRAEKWQHLGRLQLDLQQFEEAVESFNWARKYGQLSTEGKLWMADALISNDELVSAKNLLREFSSFENVDSFVFLQAALLQRSLNDPYGALATLLKGYEIDPLNSELNYLIGLLLSASEPEQALPFLERAAELDLNRKPLCEILSSMIKESASLGETSARYLYIGQVLSTYAEWDVAQRAFQKAVNLAPEDGVAWALLAEAVQQNNQDGEEYISKALELTPDAEMVNGLSALYYRRQGKSELALIYLEKALELNPEALVWEIEMGNTLSEMGDLARALEHYQAAAKINPEDWTPWRELAAFCITRNYEVEEIGTAAARQALKLNGGSPALMDLLGTALMMTNKLDEAEFFFIAADEIDPNQSAILIHLGQLYLSKGEKEKGFDYLRQAVEYAEDERLQEMAQRILSENGGDE